MGMLKESKGFEHRAPLVPSDVEWLVNRGVAVEVERSTARVFSDEEYKKSGAMILDRTSKASLLIGIKEPRVHDLILNKIYMVFSHTAKGQPHNMPLLKACLKKKIALIDYERIVDSYNTRLVYFGRFAGICGMVDSLHYLGKKLEYQGTENLLSDILPAHKYMSLDVLKQSLDEVGKKIRKRGIAKELAPFIIGITGHGNVSRGAQEVLDLLEPVEIHPANMTEFMEQQRKQMHRIYKIVFLREEKFRAKNGKGFYFEEYLRHPDKFESNLDQYIPYINLLIHTSYWDNRFPRLIRKRVINRLWKQEPFRLKFIGDLSCDVNGSIELTHKSTTPQKPVFTYDPEKRKYIDGYKSKGITVLAVDNLPAEMPRDASDDFSRLIRDYVYQVAAHGINDITNHMAIPAEIRNAVVTQNGKLTTNSSYLKKYIQTF